MKPPILFRLMLCSLFLPIIIGTCIVLVFAIPEMRREFLTDEFQIPADTMFGVPAILFPIVFMTLPFVLYFWMFRSGNWRRPVLAAALVYGSFIFAMTFDLLSLYIPPEKRIIDLRTSPGIDVYCNGVHLGQTPMKIRVDTLKAKVPEWTSPPEQRWYDDVMPTHYTWIPWDNFIKERFEASKKLSKEFKNQNTATATSKAFMAQLKARKEALNKHDSECRYWWSFRQGDTQMVVQRNDRVSYYDSFADVSDYNLNDIGTLLSPSVGYHAQLLVDVLPELTPEQKEDWDKYVLKHWGQLNVPLQSALNQMTKQYRSRDKNDPAVQLYETALHSTARLRHSTADPLTEEDARRLLAWWVRGKDKTFALGYNNETHTRNVPTVAGNALLPADIQDVIRKPLTEQWRKNKYGYKNWVPLLYFSLRDKSPDYFADFARYAATASDTRMMLLENEAPHVVTLFKTLLHRRSLSEYTTQQIDIYESRINTFASVNNPLTEVAYREYIDKALSDPKHNDSSRYFVQAAVSWAVFKRVNREEVDKDDLSAWVASLPISASSKNLALRTLRIRDDENLTFADRLQQAAGEHVLLDTELTLDDLTNWFAENPDGRLDKFIAEQQQEENITVSGDRNQRDVYYQPSFFGNIALARSEYGTSSRPLPLCFVLALLRSDTPEGDPQVRDLIRQIWKSTPELVEEGIQNEYRMFAFSGGNRQGYNPFDDDSAPLAVGFGSLHLPDYILDLYLEDSDGESDKVRQGGAIASILALCDSPKAGQILERLASVQTENKTQFYERNLQTWQIRNAMRRIKMEIFQDLLSGRMSPDDLLLPQPAWVWKDGEYVQGE